MRNTEEIIEKAYNLIKENQIENADPKILIDFYYDFYNSSAKYLYKDFEDERQVELSIKHQEICKWIVKNREYFQKLENYDHIPDIIIDEIGNKEARHISSLMFKGEFKDYKAEVEHHEFREEIEKLIRDGNKEELSSAERRYLNGHEEYYKNFYSHSINMFEKNFFNLSEKEMEIFLEKLEYSGYIENLMLIPEQKLKFEDSNLLYQYVRFVLKVKSVFRPEELINDKIIQSIYEGKISNSKIIETVFSNKDTKQLEKRGDIKRGNPFYSPEIFRELLVRDGKDTSHFYQTLVEHFKSKGVNSKTINQILNEIVAVDGRSNSLIFLADLNINTPDSFIDFLNQNDNSNEEYLTCNSCLFEAMKEKEKSVMTGRCLYIPYEYAIKNIEFFSKEAVDNLKTLIENGYYSEEEKKELVSKMKILGIYNERKEVTYEAAKKLIRDNMDNGFKINEETFKSCIRAIITHGLIEKGIDTNKIVFFGESEEENGFVDIEKIWINNRLIRNFVSGKANNEDKVRIFETMFHEMRHVQQSDNIAKGNIDFLTYNFIKEEIIRDKDPAFYSANYFKMFIEEDARQFGIIDSMKFLKELGIRDFDKIYEAYKGKLGKELDKDNIQTDSDKNTTFRIKETINIDEYTGKIIRNNPEILKEYNCILQIQYNIDGSQKGLEEILENFEAIETEEEKNKMFSIYYGIIKRKSEEKDDILPDTEKKLQEFFEKKNLLISEEDMRHYSKKSDPQTNKMVLSCFDREIHGNVDEEKTTSEKTIKEFEGKKLNKREGMDENERS